MSLFQYFNIGLYVFKSLGNKNWKSEKRLSEIRMVLTQFDTKMVVLSPSYQTQYLFFVRNFRKS